jgi:hypothetical protein
MSNDNCEPVFTVAGEIAAWQDAARSLPLFEAGDVAREAIDHLGCVLNLFNTVYRDGRSSTEALEQAVMQVARQATGAAIFTLAVADRTREAAALS